MSMLIETRTAIEAGFKDVEVLMDGEACSFKSTIITDEFQGRGSLERHKMVLSLVSHLFERSGGSLHALTLTTRTKEEFRLEK